jgi:hypothetical protein
MKAYVIPTTSLALDAVAVAPSAIFSATEEPQAMIKPVTDNFLDRPGGALPMRTKARARWSSWFRASAT